MLQYNDKNKYILKGHCEDWVNDCYSTFTSDEILKDINTVFEEERWPLLAVKITSIGEEIIKFDFISTRQMTIEEFCVFITNNLITGYEKNPEKYFLEVGINEINIIM